MTDQQREAWNRYQKMWFRRKRGNTGPHRLHYTSDELMLLSTWTDMKVPVAEQAKRLGCTKRAIEDVKARYGIGKETYD